MQPHKIISNIFRAALSFFVLFASLSVGFLPVQAQADGLFTPASNAEGTTTYQPPRYIIRSRLVHLNERHLFRADGSPLEANSQVSLNLFDDVLYTGIVTRAEQNGTTGYTWSGRLKEKSGGYFYLLTYEGALIAHIASPEGVYEVSFAGDGLYRVVQFDHARMEDDYPAEFAEPGPLLAPGKAGLEADSGSQIDILVAYTTTARLAAGSTAAIKAQIALAVYETNVSYANAGVTPRLRLVHVHEVDYNESADLYTDLSRLLNPGDGYMDNVHGLRNIYGADMVGLIVQNAGLYCGLAAAVLASASNAFQVTARECATGYYSFGHEFGHLQGARHDLYVDPNLSPFSYGHGYVSVPGLWRTVMAYDTQCADLGKHCTRLQWWSNPNKFYGGLAMGDAQAQNYKVLNTTAYTVANFRASKIGQNFSSSFTTSSGWAPVYGPWSIYNAQHYRSGGVANRWSSSRHSGRYGDVIFEAKMKRLGCAACANALLVRGNASSLTANKQWRSSYRFQYANNGKFAVYETTASGSQIALKPWTSSAAILVNNWNTLKVLAVGSLLKFYINDTLVWSGSDSTLMTGFLGIGMSRDSASSGNMLYVTSAQATTNATEELLPTLMP